MESVRTTFDASASSQVQPRRRSLLARLAIGGALTLSLCLGAAAAFTVSPNSASGGPGTVRSIHPADSASGGPGTVFTIRPLDSASGGPGTV